MLDGYLHTASLLMTAFLFGGMLFFSAGFAAFLFKYLPPEDARRLIRKAFPPFYLFVIVTSGLVMLTSWSTDAFSAAWMTFIMLTTISARQILTPAINRATDSGQKKRFQWLHGFSVLLTLGHIVLAAAILIRMAD
jgi:hypothetical protein